MNTFSTRAAAALAVLALSACGGGGGITPSTGSAPTSGTPTQSSSAKGSMSITIPPSSALAARARRAYISPSTKSAVISLVTNNTPSKITEADLTSASPNCSVPAGGGLQCTIAFVAPAGTDTLQLSLYDKTGGTGNLLSTADVSATLHDATVTSVPVSLDGVPAAATVVLGTSELPVGATGSTSLFVQATDADGNIIVGPGSFTSPIALTVNGDTYKTLALSTASVTAPGQVLTLSYNGGSNVGSTIVASGSGLVGTPATFAGHGASLNVYQYADAALAAANPTSQQSWYSYDIAANAHGNAATILYGELDVCCWTYTSYSGIATLTPTGAGTLFVGDTSDPYNVPAAGSLTVPGATVVHGMLQNPTEDEFDSYDDLAVDASGNIYYSAAFSSSSAPTCSAGTVNSGVLGILNPATGTATQYILGGTPGPIKLDSNGNAWWIEYIGSCSSTGPLLGSGSDSYAIGELKSGSTTPIETPFSAANLGSVGYPADMALSPDGSQMYVADADNSQIVNVATASFASPLTVNETNSAYAETLATAPDGTTAWFGDESLANNYSYGFIPGKKSFASANVVENTMPDEYYYSYGMTYADGSFWLAGSEYDTGIGRISGASTGTAAAGVYALPDPDNDGQENPSIAAGGGYIWASDYEYGNIDVLSYGAPGTGNFSLNATHRAGTFVARKNALKLVSHHVMDKHAHRSTF